MSVLINAALALGVEGLKLMKPSFKLANGNTKGAQMILRHLDALKSGKVVPGTFVQYEQNGKTFIGKVEFTVNKIAVVLVKENGTVPRNVMELAKISEELGVTAHPVLKSNLKIIDRAELSKLGSAPKVPHLSVNGNGTERLKGFTKLDELITALEANDDQLAIKLKDLKPAERQKLLLLKAATHSDAWQRNDVSLSIARSRLLGKILGRFGVRAEQRITELAKATGAKVEYIPSVSFLSPRGEQTGVYKITDLGDLFTPAQRKVLQQYMNKGVDITFDPMLSWSPVDGYVEFTPLKQGKIAYMALKPDRKLSPYFLAHEGQHMEDSANLDEAFIAAAKKYLPNESAQMLISQKNMSKFVIVGSMHLEHRAHDTIYKLFKNRRLFTGEQTTLKFSPLSVINEISYDGMNSFRVFKALLSLNSGLNVVLPAGARSLRAATLGFLLGAQGLLVNKGLEMIFYNARSNVDPRELKAAIHDLMNEVAENEVETLYRVFSKIEALTPADLNFEEEVNGMSPEDLTKLLNSL
jgi:hypothetical protein